MADLGLRGKCSNIWMIFSRVPNKLDKAKCDTCAKEYSYVDGSTSNRCLHIRTKHLSLASSLPSKKRRMWARVQSSASSATAELVVSSFLTAHQHIIGYSVP